MKLITWFALTCLVSQAFALPLVNNIQGCYGDVSSEEYFHGRRVVVSYQNALIYRGADGNVVAHISQDGAEYSPARQQTRILTEEATQESNELLRASNMDGNLVVKIAANGAVVAELDGITQRLGCTGQVAVLREKARQYRTSIN
jgi:hypothetical protein